MPDAFAFPGVSDVDEAVGGLDDGGVGEAAGGVGVVFEDEGGGPVFAIGGDGDVQGAAAFVLGLVAGVVIVN